MATNSSWLAAGAAMAAAGLGVGGVLGYVGHGMVVDPVATVVKETELIKRELSEEELANLCSEPIQEGRNQLSEAQVRVEDLQASLADKEAMLARLKREAEVNEAQKAAGAQAWQAMQAEIKQLKEELAVAIEERDEMKEELRVTILKLDQQVLETQRAKAEAEFFKSENTVNIWASFMAEAKVEICDRGTRKRHAKCHESVHGALSREVRDRFVECVNTYQSTPLLIQGEKDQSLPPFSEPLSEEDRFTKKGWYIQFCDPTLPEPEHHKNKSAWD